MEQVLDDQKICRRNLPKNAKFSDLPKGDQFRQLGMKSKYFLDTIKLIVYRTETAMVHTVRKTMYHQDETDAEILPDHVKTDWSFACTIRPIIAVVSRYAMYTRS